MVTKKDIFLVISNWSSVWLDPNKEDKGDQAGTSKKTKDTGGTLKEDTKKVPQKVIGDLGKNIE